MISGEDRKIFQELLPFWTKLSLDEKNYLAVNSRAMSLKEGFNIETSPEYLGLVLLKKGELNIYISSYEGRIINLYNIYDYTLEIFPSLTEENNLNFQFESYVKKDSEVIVVNLSLLEKMRKINRDVDSFYHSMVKKKFSHALNSLIYILFTPLKTRLASFLISKNSKIIEITHDEIAKNLGSSREVISRTLGDFSKKDILKTSKGKITILDKKYLMSLKSNN